MSRPFNTVACTGFLYFYRKSEIDEIVKHIKKTCRKTVKWYWDNDPEETDEEPFKFQVRFSMSYTARGADTSSVIKTLQNVYAARHRGTNKLKFEQRWNYGGLKFDKFGRNKK